MRKEILKSRSQFYMEERSVLKEDVGQKQGGLCKESCQGSMSACPSFEFLLCSPSVLDRLNALLEPGGILTVSERGMIDGSTPTVTPHPNFR